MIATTHLAVGAAAAVAVQTVLPDGAGTAEKLAVSFVAGFISHLVLDAFPHEEYTITGIQLWSILSLEIAAVFLLVLSWGNSRLANGIIFIGMAGGALPDFIELAHAYLIKWPLLSSIGRIFHLYHGAIPIASEVGFPYQILMAAIAIIFVKYKSA